MASFFGLASCGSGVTKDPSPSPRQETRSLKPEELVEAVLRHHHGAIREQMAAVVIELRESAQGPKTNCVLDLPDRLRVNHPDGTIETLLREEGRRYPPDDHQGMALEGERLAHLHKLRHHLRAIVLRPLHIATKVSATESGALSLELESGETWLLEVDLAKLNPVSLIGPAGALQFLEFLDTGFTQHATRVRLTGFGERWIHIPDGGFEFESSLFSHPRGEPITLPKTLTIVDDGADRPPTPEIQKIPASSILVLKDPGGWTQRASAIDAAAKVLYEHGQTANGLPAYVREGSDNLITIPFRSDLERGSQRLGSLDGWNIREQPQHAALVVAPPAGTWEISIKDGRASIDTFLKREGLEQEGPLRVLLIGIQGAIPSEEELQQLSLRLEQPIRGR